MSIELEIDQTEPEDSEERDSVQYQITSYPADITISGYIEKSEKSQLIIPDFQRNYVWDQVKASKLVESFLLGLPVPGVFLYKDRKTNKLLVVDGQQRITSAIRYVQGVFDEKVFRLKGVGERWEGKTFNELDEADQLQIKDTVLRATIIQQLDPQDDSSIYYIFERLNTGGVNLNPMEVRRCVYYGDFILLLERLNSDENWRKIIGSAEPDKRMRDLELLLRCVALQENWNKYSKPMKGFLNSFMLQINRTPAAEIKERLTTIEKVFERSCLKIVNDLGDKPFNVYGRLNFALLDSVFVAAAATDEKVNLSDIFDKLLKNKNYEEACRVSTSDEKSVLFRISHAVDIATGAL